MALHVNFQLYIISIFLLPSEFSREIFTVGLSKSKERRIAVEIIWLMTNIVTFCSEAAHTVHGEFPAGCQRPFCCDEGGGFILYRRDSTASVQGMCFVRVEATHRGMWQQCEEPGVACLSHCLVLPHPVEMAAACTCTHVISNTFISRLYSPSC